jgi:hypothetical protein
VNRWIGELNWWVGELANWSIELGTNSPITSPIHRFTNPTNYKAHAREARQRVEGSEGWRIGESVDWWIGELNW